ncbi:MAG TPA: hypothetical protein VMF07_21980 [Solirubrobacteraceae bacterium]|nr:hypothetical protein [Solirubrobacteraceae bacterium]
MAWLMVGAVTARASTSPFYYDGAANVGVSAPAFGGNVPGGSDNTAVGQSSLNSLTNGTFACCDTAVGALALFKTTGGYNTGTGFEALENNSSGGANTADGALALAFNSGGGSNTATGVDALEYNDTGSRNVANGAYALNVSNGNDNVAVGDATMDANQTGNEDVATGSGALQRNTTGSDNVATGFNALNENTTGGSNIAIGSGAGLNLTTGSNNIDIGSPGVAAEKNVIRIGTNGTQTKTVIAGIAGNKLSGAKTVVINSNGQLGVSSAKSASVPTAQVAQVLPGLVHGRRVSDHQLTMLLLKQVASLRRTVASQSRELRQIRALRAEVAKLAAQAGR